MGGESIYGSPFLDEDLSDELDSHGYVPILISRARRLSSLVVASGALVNFVRPVVVSPSTHLIP